MGILSIEPLDPDSYGRVELQGTRKIRTYRRRWQIIAEKDDNEAVIILDPLCPRAGSLHETDDTAYMKSFECTRQEDDARDVLTDVASIWEGVSEWTSDRTKANGTPIYPDTPAFRTYSFDRKEIPIQKDRDDVPIVNTADDPYDPPLVVEFPIPVITIKVNLDTASFSPEWMQTYQFAVNESTYDGWGPGKVIVQDISAAEAEWEDEEGGIHPYWEVTIKLAFNIFKWQPKIMSQGYNEKVGGNKRPILVNGEQPKQPLPLDESGEGLIGAAVSDAYFKEYNVYLEKDFSVFDFFS